LNIFVDRLVLVRYWFILVNIKSKEKMMI